VTKKPAQLTPTQALEGAVRRLLRPLLRLLVENQIALGRLVELIKETLVDMAERDIKSAGGTPTDTRIHLLTGVHRKDVRRLRRTSDEAPAIPPTVSLGGQIIARWTSDAACLDRAGRPRVLPLSAPAGEMSFKTLVDEIGRQDIRPRAALEELQRLGVIELDGDDRVRLQMEAFVPEKGFTEKAFYFGQNLRDHLAAGARESPRHPAAAARPQRVLRPPVPGVGGGADRPGARVGYAGVAGFQPARGGAAKTRRRARGQPAAGEFRSLFLPCTEP
jgi:hypothetical protein